MAMRVILFTVYILSVTALVFAGEDSNKKENKKDNDASQKWKKKDVRDYNDADMERLFDQWEEADDPLEEDELPEWKREPAKIDLSKLDPSDPESLLQQSKKGKTIMMFATVSGDPTEKETESITSLWHTSLFNANMETQRYVVSSDRVIFLLKDGSKAFDIKKFLVQQERCSEVTIEGQSFPGKGADKNNSSKQNQKDESVKKKKTEL